MKYNRITILTIVAIVSFVFGTLVINVKYGDGFKEAVDASTTSKLVEPSTTVPASTTTTTEEPTTTAPSPATTTTTVVVTAAPVVTTTPAVTAPPVVTIPVQPSTTVKPKTVQSAVVTSGDQAMLAAVNAERARVGKNALTMSAGLCNCASVRAKEIAISFSHTRPNGTSCFTVLGEVGVNYTACGENLAKGQTSVTDAMNSWMNSSGHRENILSSKHDYNSFGCACYTVGGVNYWVQEFAYIP